MTETKVRVDRTGILLMPTGFGMDDDERLFEFCRINREWRIERTAEGELEIMTPTRGETGAGNFRVVSKLDAWVERDGTGIGFDSSTGFVLPNGAMRSPDVSWVRRERLSALTAEQKQKFLPLCPDFVIELRSPSDQLEKIEAKMREYIENGAKLGWLLDPTERKAHVYEPGKPVEVSKDPENLSGGSVLNGFVLDPGRVWKPGF